MDTELAKTSIENLISQTKNEKDRNALIWADKRFKEAAADMQDASAKLASGQNTNYAAQIKQMKKANLSPALMYGQGGAGGGTVSGAQGQGTSQPTDRTYRDWETDRKSTRLNSSHRSLSRMPSSA